MKHQDDIKPIGLLFSVLRQAPERDSARAAAGKAAFVGQAVSLQADKRHKGWNAVVLTRKEPHKMSAMATIALVVALVFGGAGVTGVAAQGALPDQPLYRVKVLTEDMRYNLASDTAARWQLMLAFCDQRAYEIRTLAQNGAAPDDAVLARYQQQVERALQLTLQLADDQAAPALEQ
ncbi:MAG: DUF5667 domain-containing protein, partial [Chloroflexi bacterium]|nr:DUF5667 domain-containing protein [Chloroflexota bacterium]